MKLTLRQLQDSDACPNEIEIFQELFGDEVEVTEELCVKHASKFDWGWAARALLTKEQRAAFDNVTKPAGDAFILVTEPAWCALGIATKRAQHAFDLATEPARTTFNLVSSRAFAQAYNS